MNCSIWLLDGTLTVTINSGLRSKPDFFKSLSNLNEEELNVKKTEIKKREHFFGNIFYCLAYIEDPSQLLQLTSFEKHRLLSILDGGFCWQTKIRSRNDHWLSNTFVNQLSFPVDWPGLVGSHLWIKENCSIIYLDYYYYSSSRANSTDFPWLSLSLSIYLFIAPPSLWSIVLTSLPNLVSACK